MRALVVGATGAVGKDLTALLLEDTIFSEVHIFVRREVAFFHPKLKVHIIDFDNSDGWKGWVKGDVLFSCLGTTLKNAGNKDMQWKIDYDYQYRFAEIAKNNGVSHYILVSSSGADSKSLVFYTKMKGQLEDDVKKLGFPKLAIMQPPLLVRKNTDRMGEKVAEKILTFFNFLGLFLSQRPMSTDVLAQSMVRISKTQRDEVSIFTSKKIWDLGNALE